MAACKRINRQLADVRLLMDLDDPDQIEKIALGIFEAFDFHENSYDSSKNQYTRQFEDCLETGLRERLVDARLWRPIYLSTHWSNDFQFWADDVLTGGQLMVDLEAEMSLEAELPLEDNLP